MPRLKKTSEDLKAQRTYAFWVREYRERHGLTQIQLAEQTGVSRRTIQMIEKAKNIPFPKTLAALDLDQVERSDLPKFDGKISKEDASKVDRLLKASDSVGRK